MAGEELFIFHHVLQSQRVEQYCLDDGIIITDYDLKPHQLRFTTHVQPGFVGTCTYALQGPDDAPLTIRQQILLLAQLAFYYGVG
jgi:CRISPR/Cas system endoribonuclease Cas6 (RAMP superfamily)